MRPDTGYLDTRAARHEIRVLDDLVVLRLAHEGGLVEYPLGTDAARRLAAEMAQAAEDSSPPTSDDEGGGTGNAFLDAITEAWDAPMPG